MWWIRRKLTRFFLFWFLCSDSFSGLQNLVHFMLTYFAVPIGTGARGPEENLCPCFCVWCWIGTQLLAADEISAAKTCFYSFPDSGSGSIWPNGRLSSVQNLKANSGCAICQFLFYFSHTFSMLPGPNVMSSIYCAHHWLNWPLCIGSPHAVPRYFIGKNKEFW